MDKLDLRLNLLIQILTLMLVIKSIASTYFASYYSLHKQEQLIWEYANTLNKMAIFLIIPLIIISLTIFLPVKEKNKRVLEIIGVILAFLVVIISFLFF
jgi:cell division protein FtsW (lipid II flippase)